MIKEFPYIYEKGKYLPLVPVLIANKVKTYALVDSGAEISLFRSEIAEELRILIERGQKSELTGIGGRIVIYKHLVPVEVTGMKFKLRMAFSREFTASINILGRNNFFYYFIVKFDDLKRVAYLESRTQGQER